MSIWSLLKAAWVALYLLLAFPVAGHEPIHEKIIALTQRIAQDPRNAELYLKRGELYRVHRKWDAALADYERAAQIDPGLAVIDFCRGLMLLEADRPQPARLALEHFLANHPDHIGALVGRARVLVKLDQHLAAAEDFTRAITLQPNPMPEFYLERAQALAAAGSKHIDAAVQGLDAGIERLGPLVTLQLFAIDLELQRKSYGAALARLEHIESQSARKEMWLARRGETLERAGRVREAREAFRSALTAIEALPEHRRETRLMEELEKRLGSALDRLSADRVKH